MDSHAQRSKSRFFFRNGGLGFSPFIHLACEIQNLSDHELFVECHLNGDYWSTGAGYIPARSTKVIETLILRKTYPEEQLKLFPKMNGLPGGATRLWCSYQPDSIRVFSLDFPRIQPNDRLAIKSITLQKPFKEYSGKDYDALLPFVDEFGQYVHANYPGKIAKASDIVKADKKKCVTWNNTPVTVIGICTADGLLARNWRQAAISALKNIKGNGGWSIRWDICSGRMALLA